MRGFFRRLVGLHGSPLGIASGFTVGLLLSLVPIPFAGMLVALVLAPVLRMNVPATYLGTAVINPFTGAFFYFAELWVGRWLLRGKAPSWAELQRLDAHGWWALFVDSLLPFVVGMVVVMAVCGALAFPSVLWISRRYSWHRARKAASHPHPPRVSRAPSPPAADGPG